MDTSNRILGSGTYGTVITTANPNHCRKVFTKQKALSMIREFYIMKKLSYIRGIGEFVTLDDPRESDSNLIGEPPWGVIVMKRYSKTLVEWLALGQSYEERLRVLKDIVRIMTEVHAAGIVHADIKLENIMMTIDNEVRIIDWGLSGPCGYARIHLTTKTYRPKIITQDFCHDIYSLGIIATELALASVLVNLPNYEAHRQLLKSTVTDRRLEKMISKMIHPNCISRPDITEIANLFQLSPYSRAPETKHKLIQIPSRYGVPSMEYPIIFSTFLEQHPHAEKTAIGIMGSIYSCSDPNTLLENIEYRDIKTFSLFAA
jgi:serine/threonine protein kinase